MSENEYQENIHFIMSHPEAVAREMIKRADRIAQLEAARKGALDLAERHMNEKHKLRVALRGIKWRSADKDNMEFAATITYSQMDAIRAALGEERT